MKFLSSKKENYMIIIGCGRLGANIANTISDSGGNVIVIDKDKDSFRKLSSSFGGLTLVADGTDLDALKEAQIEKANIVIAVTNNDNINIMISQLVHEIFNIEHVIARLYDSERECIYKELGIDIICPSILSIKEMSKLLKNCYV